MRYQRKDCFIFEGTEKNNLLLTITYEYAKWKFIIIGINTRSFTAEGGKNMRSVN